MSEMNKENAREIKLDHDSKIDDIANTLVYLGKITTEKFFVNFNGVKLYTDFNLTLDDVYQQVFGKTRSEFISERNAILEEHDKKNGEYREEAKSLIEQRFEEGKKYMYPEREEEWRKLLSDLVEFAPQAYDGRYPDLMIECMKRLENGEEFQSILDFVKEVGNGSLGLVGQIMPFSKVGPEFYEYVYRKEDPTIFEDNYHKKELEDTKEENRRLAEFHKSERTVSVSEVGDVARGETVTSKNGAINAVTSPEEEKIVEGQSHNDE